VLRRFVALLLSRRRDRIEPVEGSFDRNCTPTQRAALARLTRATAQLARWHAEYEDALTAAWEAKVPYPVLASATGESRQALDRRLGESS
jgi:hypothetical protein